MYQTSNILSVGHSHILSVNLPKGEFVTHFCIFLLTWMTYGQFDYQQI